MKTFLALFTCAENSKTHEAWKKLSPQVQEDRMVKGELARKQWSTKYGMQILFDGGALGKTTKTVDTKGTRETPSQMGAFLVVQAESFDEAATMFVDHPHFSIFPGDGVEIIERVETRND